MRCSIALVVLLAAQLVAHSAWCHDTPKLTKANVFTSGKGDYHSYRIPSCLVTAKGTVLAFCEGRKNSRSDSGDIDLVMRRSTDGGATWSRLAVVWSDGANTCGNPCPVVDETTGTIWMLMTWNDGKTGERAVKAGYGTNSRRVFVTHSTDDGVTWSQPKNITSEVKDETWSWYATGPGAGIQIKSGPHRGRLVIPCDHKIPTGGGLKFKSHIIYSDDHGETWQLGGSSPADQVNECEVVELAEGKLLLNMRNYDRADRSRQVCYSDDGGVTWRDQQHDSTLIAPTCQASIRRYRWPSGAKPGVVLFTNPASKTKRVALTIRASYDDCRSWKHSRLLHAGESAYSSLAVLPNREIACLYEKDGYRHITLARFPLVWVESEP